MTPLRPTAPLPLRSPGQAPAPDRPTGPPGLDGVVGDVLVTVLLAAALAAIVGGLLWLLWRALPSASRMAALTFAMAVPPLPRRRGAGDAQNGESARAVLLRVAAAGVIPMVAIGGTLAFWSGDEIVAPVAIVVGLLLVVVELEILGSESWRRTRRIWRGRLSTWHSSSAGNAVSSSPIAR